MSKKIISIVLIILFLASCVIAKTHSYSDYDLIISHLIQQIKSPYFDRLMRIVSGIGEFPVILILIAGVVLMFLKAKLKIEAYTTVFLTAVGTFTGWLVKAIVNRPRPDPSLVETSKHFTGKSFPSLHALIFTLFFGYLLYLSLTKISVRPIKYLFSLILIFLIVSISISRIYLGAHWASDTIGGYLLGIIFIREAIAYAKR